MNKEAVEPEVVEPEVVEPQVVEPVELSPMEEQAQSQGWVPKEEWVENGGDVNEWRSAKEFVERGELYKSLHTTKRDLKQTQAALGALQKHHASVFEKAHAQAVAELKHERRLAMREGDLERVEELEDEIETVAKEHNKSKQEFIQEQAQAASAGPNPAFLAWVDKNPWYNADAELRDEIDAIAIIYAKKNPGAGPEAILEHSEKVIRKRHPTQFEKRGAPSAVAGSTRAGAAKKSVGSGEDLDEMEIHIMKTLVQTGTMTEKEYRAELAKAKGK